MAGKGKPKKTTRKKTTATKQGKAGRPLTLTEPLIKTIAANIKVSQYVETAITAAKVPKQTYYDWLTTAAVARDKIDNGTAPSRLTAKEQMCMRLSDSVKEALAEAELDDNRLIQAAAKSGAWQAAAWRLERRHPDRYGKRDHHTLAGDADAPIHTKAETRIIDYTDALREQEERQAAEDAEHGAPE